MGKSPATPALTLLILLLAGCSQPTGENPIIPGGEVPELLAGLPDLEYLAIGYLNLDKLFASEIGNSLASHPLLNIALMALSARAQVPLKLEEQFHEIAVAVRFNPDAYPNLYPALPTICLARVDLSGDDVRKLLGGGEAEPSTIDGVQVLSYSGNLPMLAQNIGGTTFVASLEDGLVVVSTSKTLMEEYFAARRGDAAAMGKGGLSADLLARADKRVTGWLVMRHSGESRTLLKGMLETFDDCLLSLDAGEELKITCVVDFAEESNAREMVTSFQLGQKELKQLKTGEGSGPERAAIDAGAELFSRIRSRQSVDLAIFEAELSLETINKLISAEIQARSLSEKPAAPVTDR